VVLLSIIAVIFALVRWRRNRRFQQSYAQKAQANAAAMNMVAPTYPTPAYPMHQNHDYALQHHNQAMEQANMQNQINMQNQMNQNNMMATSAPGIGGMSGSTGVMV
jgi:hypothetical protein